MQDCYSYEAMQPDHVTRLKKCFKSLGWTSSLEDVFWMPVPDKYLSALQYEHLEQCGPYMLCIETTGTDVSIELLVRAGNALHCTCIGTATPELRCYALDFLDKLFRSLSIA